jgi:sulfite reductase (ferredoxin)
MQSFRTELENPVVEKDIIHLEKSIRLFREGTLNEEKFRSLRLARGVYGQRQPGVQMIRIKLPYGKMTVKQLLRICDVSDEYATKNLHLTTRQDIQIHYVSLDRTPELWAELEKDNITLREACGNTVRNVTASYNAGIDPNEAFDVCPYAHAVFEYFLRNPICQDMGRKIKIAFSSSETDTALTFMHDFGFIPKLKVENGKEVRGFKVLVGGGLGSQPMLARVAYEFLETDLIIPFIEASLRVFDRYGERNTRSKARMKFLINKVGFEEFMNMVEKEKTANKSKTYKIDYQSYKEVEPPVNVVTSPVEIKDKAAYDLWFETSVFEQKQKGYYAVCLKVVNGDIKTDRARKLAEIVKKYAADDVRVTINQGMMLKFVPKEALPNIYTELSAINLAEPGFDRTFDITSCPGTDTCNLGISSSTGATEALEKVIRNEFPEMIRNNDIKIKLSGCMNACGQHTIANIGFHGSSLKAGAATVPALQVLIGGGNSGNGEGRMADKIIKVPSKRGTSALRMILSDYENNALEGEYFNSYYDRVNGKDHFYNLLKPLKDLDNLTPDEFIDWGHSEQFETAIGVGECAGVMIDLVATLLFEAEEKIQWAKETLEAGHYADSIYHTYSFFVSAAKALLVDKQVLCNTHNGIINDFDKHYVATGLFTFDGGFRAHILRINENQPTKEFATLYLNDAIKFAQITSTFRQKVLDNAKING